MTTLSTAPPSSTWIDRAISQRRQPIPILLATGRARARHAQGDREVDRAGKVIVGFQVGREGQRVQGVDGERVGTITRRRRAEPDLVVTGLQAHLVFGRKAKSGGATPADHTASLDAQIDRPVCGWFGTQPEMLRRGQAEAEDVGIFETWQSTHDTST